MRACENCQYKQGCLDRDTAFYNDAGIRWPCMMEFQGPMQIEKDQENDQTTTGSSV